MATAQDLALELRSKLLSDLSYQERVIENAGECYPGHSEAVANSKKLLNAVDEFIAFNEKSME